MAENNGVHDPAGTECEPPMKCRSWSCDDRGCLAAQRAFWQMSSKNVSHRSEDVDHGEFSNGASDNTTSLSGHSPVLTRPPIATCC
jgi:hypothetical protein